VKVTSCPPVQVGSRAPRQAVSATITSPVPRKDAPPIERERSVMGEVELTLNWNSESSSSTPLLVEANQPALNCKPGLPGVVMGVTPTAPAAIAKPGGFDVPV